MARYISLPAPSSIEGFIKPTMLAYQEPYMLIGYPVRSLTQIECGEVPSDGALSREPLIWFLRYELHELPCLVKTRDLLHHHRENGLLHILHSSRFNSDDSGTIQRLRDGNNPYRYFIPRFEDLYVVQPLKLDRRGRIGYEVFPVWEHLFQPSSPPPKYILRVAAKLISGGSRAMFRREHLVVQTIVYTGEELTPKKVSYSLEIFDPPLFREEQ